MPPQSLSATLCPVPSLFYPPWPRTGPGGKPGPSSSLPTLSRSAQTVRLTRIFPKAQGTLSSALGCALTSSSFCLPLAWGFRTSCHMGSRKEAPDWLVEERVELELGLNSNLAPPGLLRSSFKGREGLGLVSKTSIYKLSPCNGDTATSCFFPGPLYTRVKVCPLLQCVLTWPASGVVGSRYPHRTHCTCTRRFHLFPSLPLRS